MRKAFVLTIDALLALAIVMGIFSTVLVFTQHAPQQQKYLSMEALARDYLVLQKAEIPIDTTDDTSDDKSFFKNTGFHISTSEPPDNSLVVHSSIIYYPVCNGQTTLNKDDACLTKQDDSDAKVENAWVTP